MKVYMRHGYKSSCSLFSEHNEGDWQATFSGHFYPKGKYSWSHSKILLKSIPTENINIGTHSVAYNFRLSKLSWLLPGSKSTFLLITLAVFHSSSIFHHPYTEVSTL